MKPVTKLFLAAAIVLTGIQTTAAEPWSVRMVRSEMQRHPDPLGLDFLPSPKWTYTVGLELRAIGNTYDRHGDERLKDYIIAYADHMVDQDGSIKTYKKSDYNVDMVCSGRMLLWAIDHTADQSQKDKFKKAADLLRSQLDEQPTTSEGGYWHKKIYPWQIWLDGLYMAEPFMAEYLTRYDADNTAAWEHIAHQFDIAAKHTFDPATGLYRHAWDERREQPWADKTTGQSQCVWGRALGWYVMALVDVLDMMPAQTKGRDRMVEILRGIYDNLTRYKDPRTGMWFQVIDQGSREGNYTEATCSAMFTYGMLRGVDKGYLDASLLPAAKKTYKQLVKTFIKKEKDGTISLIRCCEVAGLGGKDNRSGTFEYYMSEPIRDNDPKGVGPFIWASLERESVK